jgi:hypothetical protein
LRLDPFHLFRVASLAAGLFVVSLVEERGGADVDNVDGELFPLLKWSILIIARTLRRRPCADASRRGCARSASALSTPPIRHCLFAHHDLGAQPHDLWGPADFLEVVESRPTQPVALAKLKNPDRVFLYHHRLHYLPNKHKHEIWAAMLGVNNILKYNSSTNRRLIMDA